MDFDLGLSITRVSTKAASMKEGLGKGRKDKGSIDHDKVLQTPSVRPKKFGSFNKSYGQMGPILKYVHRMLVNINTYLTFTSFEIF